MDQYFVFTNKTIMPECLFRHYCYTIENRFHIAAHHPTDYSVMIEGLNDSRELKLLHSGCP
jgi:hypothetical protein